jgi:hypothetical protein
MKKRFIWDNVKTIDRDTGQVVTTKRGAAAETEEEARKIISAECGISGFEGPANEIRDITEHNPTSRRIPTLRHRSRRVGSTRVA